MSRPNFENINRWFFEYTEGNLSVDQESNLFDFLELHPELMSDLKAWRNAKVKAPLIPPFASESLIKTTPLLLRPFSLVSIAFLALGLAWFGFTLIPSAPLYSKTAIDAEIIDTEIDNTDIYINQLLALANDENQAVISNTEIINSNFAEQKSHSKSKAELGNKNDLTSVTSIHQTNLINEIIENSEIADSRTEDLIGEENIASNQERNSKEKQIRVKANDLDLIAGYLNHTDFRIQEENIEENIADINSKSIKHTSARKSSFKKTLNSTYRKIKRMADYPVAMQNTKNPHFHVPMMSGFKANPAMVGTAPGNRIQATSRLQWLNESNSQVMNSLSWDGYIYALRGGVGIDVNYNNYQYNELSNYSAALTYSPKLSINKKISFEPALRMKMGVINLDQQSSSIGNAIELERRNIVSLFENEQEANGKQLWYRDIGLGFMINTEWFYAGFNADNLGRHNNNFFSSDLEKEYKSDIHYTAVMGTEYASKTRDTRLSGYALYQNYGDLNELWLGSNFQYKWIQIGAGASSNGDVAASLGTVFKRYSLHYNIDLTQSRLLNKQNISHQVSMRFLLKPSRYVAKFLKL